MREPLRTGVVLFWILESISLIFMDIHSVNFCTWFFCTPFVLLISWVFLAVHLLNVQYWSYSMLPTFKVCAVPLMRPRKHMYNMPKHMCMWLEVCCGFISWDIAWIFFMMSVSSCVFWILQKNGSNNVPYTTVWFRHFLPRSERKLRNAVRILFPFGFIPIRAVPFRSSPKAEKARFAAATQTLRQLRTKHELSASFGLGSTIVGESVIEPSRAEAPNGGQALYVREWHLRFLSSLCRQQLNETARNEIKPNQTKPNRTESL